MMPALAVGALFGVGVLLVVRGFMPPRTDLAAAIGRWEISRAQASARSVGTSLSWSDRAGHWFSSQMARRGVDVSPLRPDLEITGQQLEVWIGKVVLAAGVGLLSPSVLAVMAKFVGLELGVSTPMVAGLFFAATAVAIDLAKLRKEAADRRAELLQALATYLDLFSLCLASGRGIPEAMNTSARLGRGWAFGLFQDTITQARRAGVTPWQALGDLGSSTGLQELVDLGSALTLVGDSGAKVRSSLIARAGTLRRRQLAEASAQAAKNDDSMRLSQLLMAAGFLLLIGYPAMASFLAV
jgi:tight adherence protein C